MTGPSEPSDAAPAPPPPRDPVQRWRLVLERAALGPDEAQRSQQAAWEATLAGSGLPVAGLDGPRARPRFAAGAPLGASIPGEAELLDVWLTERLPRWRVREALDAVLPPGHALVDLADVWLGEPPLPGRVVASVYRAVLGGDVPAGQVRAAAVALLAADTLPRERRKGEATVAYDLRPFLSAIEVVEGEAGPGRGQEGRQEGRQETTPGGPVHTIVRMTLRHDPEKGIGRPEEVLAALGDRVGGPLHLLALVRECLVLADPPVPAEAPAPRGRRARPGSQGPGRGPGVPPPGQPT